MWHGRGILGLSGGEWSVSNRCESVPHLRGVSSGSANLFRLSIEKAVKEFFFEKKNQKTFPGCCARGVAGEPDLQRRSHFND
jgi:hypothetical protein